MPFSPLPTTPTKRIKPVSAFLHPDLHRGTRFLVWWLMAWGRKRLIFFKEAVSFSIPRGAAEPGMRLKKTSSEDSKCASCPNLHDWPAMSEALLHDIYDFYSSENKHFWLAAVLEIFAYGNWTTVKSCQTNLGQVSSCGLWPMPLYVFMAYQYAPNLPEAGTLLLTTQPKHHPT